MKNILRGDYMAVLKTKIKLRRADYEKLQNIVLSNGEPCYITDKAETVVGDGVSTVAQLLANKKTKFEHVHPFTPTGSVTSSFIGNSSTISPIFRGKQATLTVDINPQGSITINDYTPSGSVSAPIFSGKQATISSTYTPAGTISSVVQNVETSSGSIKSVADVGKLPSWECQYDSSTATLSFSWMAGALPTTKDETVLSAATITTGAPTFTGTKGTGTASYTPSGTISAPLFTGDTADLTGEFNGSMTTGQIVYTPEGTIDSITYTPSGTVSSTFIGNSSTTENPN